MDEISHNIASFNEYASDALPDKISDLYSAILFIVESTKLFFSIK